MASAPDRLQVADLPQVWKRAGFCWAAFVIDAVGRRIVGWHPSHPRSDLALRQEDVDLKAGRLCVHHSLANVAGSLTRLEPKTDRSRRLLVLLGPVRVALRAHRTRQQMDRLVAGSRWSDSGHVFAWMLGRPHHAATISRTSGRALALAALPPTRFHALRHSAATFLLSRGFGLDDIEHLPGQRHIVPTSITDGHILERRQQELARGMDAVLDG